MKRRGSLIKRTAYFTDFVSFNMFLRLAEQHGKVHLALEHLDDTKSVMDGFIVKRFKSDEELVQDTKSAITKVVMASNVIERYLKVVKSGTDECIVDGERTLANRKRLGLP